jgi:hypothetical protein
MNISETTLRRGGEISPTHTKFLDIFILSGIFIGLFFCPEEA